MLEIRCKRRYEYSCPCQARFRAQCLALQAFVLLDRRQPGQPILFEHHGEREVRLRPFYLDQQPEHRGNM